MKTQIKDLISGRMTMPINLPLITGLQEQTKKNAQK